MAEEQEEEIVIIEDSDAASQDSIDAEEASQIQSEADAQQKKRLILFGAIAALLLIIIIVVALLIIVKTKKKEKPAAVSTTAIEQKLQTPSRRTVAPSKIESLIAKANFLYTNGQKEQALKLYEYIAQYSEAISQYNLGVARLKNKQYEDALQSFNQALQNGEKRCVSAINAAVCAVYLGRPKEFRYYIDLAEAYLPDEINAPLYPYYYALIKFYRQNYYESLAAVDKVTHPEYAKRKYLLKAKLATLFDSNYDAIEALEELKSQANPMSKALLYARVGDLVLAKANFEEAIAKEIHIKDASLGLIYTKLKLGQISDAAQNLKDANEQYADVLLDAFPLRVFLKHSLFDPIKAQMKYRKAILEDESIYFQEIFYFSPYKIFNANQTIDYIRKGNATAYIDSVDSATTFLRKSASTSQVNKGIAQAIKLALRFRIRQANELLQKLVAVQPKHSILHYDLALTFAQLGDMHNAYKHFIWSYHLDAKNYLPGIYAYMCSRLIHSPDQKLLTSLKEAIVNEPQSEQIEFYKTLLHIAQGQWLNAIDWLDKHYKTRPIYLIVTNLVASHLKKQEQAQKAAKELVTLLPHEILPHLIYMDTEFRDYSKALYAKEAAKYIKKQRFSYFDLYYGAAITRDLFVQHHLITGRLFRLVSLLRKRYEISVSGDTVEIQQALAQALFYNKNFEESYVIYNSLIDEQKIQDAKTLFLAATAAIEARHHENAIALLELSKLKDRKFLETRYALALLYFEANNSRGASIELGRMGTNNFHSKYFDFDIDLEKLTFYRMHPNAKR